MVLTPVMAAPRIAPMAAISSSIWMNLPPARGRRTDMCSAISEEGEMGYPAKNRQPAAMAASAHASFPWRSRMWPDLVWVLTRFPLLWAGIPPAPSGDRTSADRRQIRGRLPLGPPRLAKHDDGEVRAELLTPQALGTGVQRPDLHLVHPIHHQDVLRAELHADGAPFTPGVVDLDRHTRADVRLGRRPGRLQHLLAGS